MKHQSRVFIRKLLAWYRRHARALPWRDTRNPYAILVSEFMLQQTQVSRVLDYYPRFLARFPTIGSLARSRPKAVMEAWDGLGYYARARNLHALAKQVTRRHDGRLPENPVDLQTLPGVGRYTAGAVACFAYEKPVPTVDTNVSRVIRRAFFGEWGAGSGTQRPKATQTALWTAAQSLTPRNGKRAWRFNQALMELGALVCSARKPKCAACPVRAECRWLRDAEKSARQQRRQRQDARQRREDRLASP
jgi:A/G-specific adenine glycosylase